MAEDNRWHKIGRELHEELQHCPDAQLILGYAEYRQRFNVTRRDTDKLNQLRAVLASDCKVLVNPEVNGKRRSRAVQEWSSFEDESTSVVCCLRGAHRGTGQPQPRKEINADANLWVTDDNFMQVVASKGMHPHPLYGHQTAALSQMTEKLRAGVAGVLVLPTGGGKTRTAVHWLLSEVVDKGGKVLWLAHRHSLIDQACNAFCQTAYCGDVLHHTDHFTCRKVSGRHARPFEITAADDVVIGSVFSLGRSTGLKYLLDKWLSDDRPICVVVDEAHHAPAPTYRKVIEEVRDRRPDVRVLGLTATPYRTAKGEQGLMKKMFPGDIIYKVDLLELISQGILAEPHFEEVQTNINFELDDDTLKKLIRTGGDFGRLGEAICETIGHNAKRNQLIVDHYCEPENRKKYGRTIIFALNIANAIALTKLLENKGVAAGYVVSSVHDAEHYVRIDAEKNEKTIQDFRDGKLTVLVNVNILTEGFDDPSVQTVFLARPTMSTILMMQMVGRALRGTKTPGGTKTANIVSFIDDWADKIHWKSPDELMAREEAEFATTPEDREKAVLRLVAIRLIEEYATFLDSKLEQNVFGDVPFTRRIPVGVYVVSMLDEWREPDEDDCARDKTADILVFEHAASAFEELLADAKASDVPEPGTNEFERYVDQMMKRHFADIAGLPFSPRRDEIRTLLGHIAKQGEGPRLMRFDQRDKYDVDKIAKDICEQELGPRKILDYLRNLWDADQLGWSTLFGKDFDRFRTTVQELVNRMALADRPSEVSAPRSILAKKSVEDCSLSELYEKHPEKWKELHDAVYDAAYDRKLGQYRCAATGWRSTDRHDFQIDHIKPWSAGGKTVLENLRLLRRRENAKKGQKWEEE
jgi:superfamily II DNA or RNA helicase